MGGSGTAAAQAGPGHRQPGAAPLADRGRDDRHHRRHGRRRRAAGQTRRAAANRGTAAVPCTATLPPSVTSGAPGHTTGDEQPATSPPARAGPPAPAPAGPPSGAALPGTAAPGTGSPAGRMSWAAGQGSSADHGIGVGYQISRGPGGIVQGRIVILDRGPAPVTGWRLRLVLPGDRHYQVIHARNISAGDSLIVQPGAGLGTPRRDASSWSPSPRRAPATPRSAAWSRTLRASRPGPARPGRSVRPGPAARQAVTWASGGAAAVTGRAPAGAGAATAGPGTAGAGAATAGPGTAGAGAGTAEAGAGTAEAGAGTAGAGAARGRAADGPAGSERGAWRRRKAAGPAAGRRRECLVPVGFLP